jgi:hypothetical protein
MTAVEWLIQQIDNKDMGEIPTWVYDLCYDAKEMEKQQIIDAAMWMPDHFGTEFLPELGKQYYDKKFKDS